MEVFDALARARGRGEPVVLVTCLQVEGEAPSEPGARLVVGRQGPVAGTLGNADLDAAAAAVADEALAAQQPVQRRIGPEEAVEVVAEWQPPEPAVLVLGATPAGREVAQLGHRLGRRAVVCAPGGDTTVGSGVQVRADDPTRYLLAAPPGRGDAVVVADHEARWADEALRVALASEAFFVGVLVTAQDAAETVRRLRHAGVPDAHVTRLRAPCGLDIGGRSPEETALSVMAEVVAVERGVAGGPRGIDWAATPT